MADQHVLVTFLVTRDGERGHPMDTIVKGVDLADDGSPVPATLERLAGSIVREVARKAALGTGAVAGGVPRHCLEVTGLTADDPESGDQTSGIQFSVLDPDGTHTTYGDQSWVASGQCIKDGSHPDGRIQYRTITITYGEWEDHG